MRYELVRADKSWLRQLLSLVVPLDSVWMTYRFPFRAAVVTYPVGTSSPSRSPTLKHEEHHVKQLGTWYGPLWLLLLATLLPLPVFFSGRWFIERRAYLGDINRGQLTADRAADILWSRYGMCWPKALMRRWFYKHRT